MASIPISVLGVATLFAVVVATEPIARRVNLPLSITLVIVGAILGFSIDIGNSVLSTSLTISSEAFLYLFLPVLLFETAIDIDVRRLLADIGPILLLAVVAVLGSTVVVGFALAATSTYGLLACLLLAAIISTTDPVAVVALFKDLSVPHRLSLLVEGESLFNDAAAIALFSVLMTMLTSGSGDWSDAVWAFLRGFSGGLLVGFVLAFLATHLLTHLPGKRTAEVTVTVTVAYLAFVIGELAFQVSGVVAVVSAALVFSYDGRTRVSPETWSFLVRIWKQLGYWASSLIFLLAALRIPDLLSGAGLADILMLGVLVLSALAARGMVLFGLMPLMSAVGMAQKVESGLRLVILWGGLRGAISLALAMAVLEHPAVPPEIKRLVSTLVTAFVLFTLFVNGLTLRPLIRALNIDRLSSVDRILRGRAIAHSLSTVRHRLDAAADQYRIDSIVRKNLAEDYTRRLQDAEISFELDNELSAEQRLRVALVAAARREQVLHLQHYRERIVSGRIVRNLVAQAYHLEDGARSDGRHGYELASRRELAFPLEFRLSIEVYRWFGLEVWLAGALADRLETLLVGRATTHTLLRFAEERIPEMLGPETAKLLLEVLEKRREAIEDTLSALRLQYGDFAEKMQVRYLERAALRIEHAEYLRLFNEAVISREVLRGLLGDLSARWRSANRRPSLDLRLSAMALLVNVPLFQNLETSVLEAIAAVLKPRFALPGEKVIRKGEKGQEMFFVASGALEVALPGQTQRLGSGDFFGELALLTQSPRSADVTALGFCELLVMTADDFASLLTRNSELNTHVTETAKVRLARG
ncbi:cation:proton antiporter [Ferribacterium limneticum]|uniref:cation:proton antiporter n=1 Tax=Ferribacterium limneticum TaxID=76259 RepID=UPI001CF86BE6|nr:cation:proton antiporter [Ferribacterium limneticum]UCV24345.1 cation:proton antiporter [Ferribacterium limneticum]